MATAAIAARNGSDSNQSSVSSSADIDIARITRNMSLPPSRRNFHASLASGRPSDQRSTCGNRGMGVR